MGDAGRGASGGAGAGWAAGIRAERETGSEAETRAENARAVKGRQRLRCNERVAEKANRGKVCGEKPKGSGDGTREEARRNPRHGRQQRGKAPQRMKKKHKKTWDEIPVRQAVRRDGATRRSLFFPLFFRMPFFL